MLKNLKTLSFCKHKKLLHNLGNKVKKFFLKNDHVFMSFKKNVTCSILKNCHEFFGVFFLFSFFQMLSFVH